MPTRIMPSNTNYLSRWSFPLLTYNANTIGTFKTWTLTHYFLPGQEKLNSGLNVVSLGEHIPLQSAPYCPVIN